MNASTLPIVFDCRGDQLCGFLHRPANVSAPLGVLVIVGGPQYRAGSHRQFTLMAQSMAASGVAVLRFDYRGMGDSDGEMRTFEHVDDDIRVAIDVFMKEISGLAGVVLWGLCDGASAALMYSSRDPRVKGLILANPWVRTQASEAQAYLRHYYVTRFFQPSFWKKVFGGQFNVIRSLKELAGTVAKSRSANQGSESQSLSFIERMIQSFESFRGPTLLLISSEDLTAKEFVDLCRQSQRWERAFGRTGVEKVPLAGADHTFSSRKDLQAATAACTKWLEAQRAKA